MIKHQLELVLLASYLVTRYIVTILLTSIATCIHKAAVCHPSQPFLIFIYRIAVFSPEFPELNLDSGKFMLSSLLL